MMGYLGTWKRGKKRSWLSPNNSHHVCLQGQWRSMKLPGCMISIRRESNPVPFDNKSEALDPHPPRRFCCFCLFLSLFHSLMLVYSSLAYFHLFLRSAISTSLFSCYSCASDRLPSQQIQCRLQTFPLCH
jgi:hypothetical protein